MLNQRSEVLGSDSGDPRIVEGHEVDPPHKYPFMVYMEAVQEDGTSFFQCGGSLISKIFLSSHITAEQNFFIVFKNEFSLLVVH